MNHQVFRAKIQTHNLSFMSLFTQPGTPGANLIRTFLRRVITLLWNNANWLVKTFNLTYNNQLGCFISE